jgi:AcrR family transcriptional regulator
MNIHSRRTAATAGVRSAARSRRRGFDPKDRLPMTVATPNLRVPTSPDRRQTDILEAVHGTFVEKGFDGASMQDLARAAGMSVGNFYRYFESKDAIVEALIAYDISRIEQDFATIIQSDKPLDALRETLRTHVEETSCNRDGRLWAEITAAAVRKPRVAEALSRMEDDIRRYLSEVFARATGLSAAEADRRYRGHASLVMMLVKASAMCPPTQGTPLNDLNALVLRTIGRTLDEIETDAAKG